MLENVSFDMQPERHPRHRRPQRHRQDHLPEADHRPPRPAGQGDHRKTVDLCHVDQERETLDPARTVCEEIADSQDIIKLGKQEMNSRSYVAKFNFTGPDQQQTVGSPWRSAQPASSPRCCAAAAT